MPAASDVNLDELIGLSRRYGADPDFVLAGGGNTSLKSPDGATLHVKASGHALADISAAGFVALRRNALADLLAADDLPVEPTAREAAFVHRVLAARARPELGQRPSVEALLHHLMPARLVVHTHPAVVNAMTCCEDGPGLAAEVFGGDAGVLWQDYVDPGLTLARALADALAEHRRRAGRDADVVLLQNHGLVVAADSAEGVARRTEEVVDAVATRFERPWPQSSSAGLDADILRAAADALVRLRPSASVAADASPEVAGLLGSPRALAAGLAGPLTPDHIVYCRGTPLWLESTDETDVARRWSDYESAHGVEPWAALVEGGGVLAARETPALARTTLALWRDAARVLVGAADLGGVRVMPPRDRAFVESWEVEAYRRSVARDA